MGIIREILDTIKDVSALGAGSVEDVFKKRRHGSLSRQSLEGTLQFPVIVSKSLDLETLQMITKALERQYASFVQVALTMNPKLDLSNDKDAIGYLRKFHQNSNVRTSTDDVRNAFNNILSENYMGFADDAGDKLFFAAVYEGSTANLVVANKEQLQDVLEGIREEVLNNKFIPKSPLYSFQNDNLNQYHNAVTEASKNRNGNKRSGGTTISYGDGADARRHNENNYSGDVNQGKYNMTQMGDVDNSNTVSSMVGGNSNSNNTTNSTFTGQIANITMQGGKGAMQPEKFKYDLPNNVLKDNDARKANELVPTTMHVRTILMNKEKENQGTMDFLVGIKATMHPVSSDEMVTNILHSVKSKGKFFNSIRWTSGEISFFKDFLFNIKDIKNDVSRRSAGASPWWIALKRRRSLAKLKGAMMLPNQILPNASIVLSMEEVNYIHTEFGYDLMNPMFVNKIMDTFFLLGFVIVDDSSQIAHFLFDGQQDYQSVTFNGLERDQKGGGGADLKDVLKLVQRI